MSIYIVTKKETGEEVFRYRADVATEYVGFEFDAHEHTPTFDEEAAAESGEVTDESEAG